MAMNFPNSPTTGQLYPSPPVAGQPVYRWDGSEWTTQGVQPNKMPVYTDGSTPMVAALTLSGDPVNPTDAADKHYIDNISKNSINNILAVRVFDTPGAGTYVPTVGMRYAIAEAVGGGCGGCGQAGTASYFIWGAGGGSGAYARKLLTAAQVGASLPIFVAGGGAGGGGGAVGNPGGDTTIGSLLVAKGCPSQANTSTPSPGGPLAGCVGDVTQAGNPGFFGGQVPQGDIAFACGQGANSVLGGGAMAVTWSATTATGNNANGPGGGGSGGEIGQAGGVAGGNGGNGRIIITEFD